eukprot:1157653-Pelagomonas_calceolata.AAC.15
MLMQLQSKCSTLSGMPELHQTLLLFHACHLDPSGVIGRQAGRQARPHVPANALGAVHGAHPPHSGGLPQLELHGSLRRCSWTVNWWLPAVPSGCPRNVHCIQQVFGEWQLLVCRGECVAEITSLGLEQVPVFDTTVACGIPCMYGGCSRGCCSA